MPTHSTKRNDSIALGVFSRDDKAFIYSAQKQNKDNKFRLEVSTDGLTFQTHDNDCRISDGQKRTINPAKCQSLHVAKTEDGYFLTYKYLEGKRFHLYGAKSKGLTNWQNSSKIEEISETGIVVDNFRPQGKYVMYFGENVIKLAKSIDLKKWQVEDQAILEPFENYSGSSPLEVAHTHLSPRGILLFYFIHQKDKDYNRYYLKVALFDKDNPSHLLQRSADPIWESPSDWLGEKIEPLGVTSVNGNLISYWQTKEGIARIIHPLHKKPQEENRSSSFFFKKLAQNPILKPIAHHLWESKATFNPAAVEDSGKIHLIYRAIGDSDISVLGYAQTTDGIHIDVRLPQPIYVPTQPFETGNPNQPVPIFSPYASGGGGFGGCEDPRITKIDDRFYLTYVAYDGSNPPRIALSSIAAEDFQKHNWKNWEKPILISPPNEIDKNACILPEKINGKFVIFHRIFPDILIDFVDDLNFDGNSYLNGQFAIKPRKHFWDSRKIGAGPPPIKTDDGWLLIYQAVGNQDSSRYKIGAMLLDADDPTRVLFRSDEPIIEPQEWYENEGFKSGVVYPCGAVVLKEKLLVYYGGADMFVCVAEAPVDEFLSDLKTHKKIPWQLQEVSFATN